METIHKLAERLDLGIWAAAGAVGLQILLIISLALAAQMVSTRLIRTVRIRIASRMTDGEQIRRAETLGRVLRYFATVLITVIAAIMVLSAVGISIAPFLGAAGVVGLAIGFGAQSLVKDYFTGFFLLLENQIRIGDVIQAADKTGVVEELTLRYLRLRDYAGNVYYVPNGQITVVTNMSAGYAYAVIDLGVAYGEDVDRVIAVMREVGSALRQDADFGPKILDDLEIAGVDQWADSAVVIRCRFRVAPGEQWSVRREYLRQAKAAFDRAGIEIPFPHVKIVAPEALPTTA